MIDTNFIIRYTNGLYSVPTEMAPRYDEFRDMFSSGQLHSKKWLVDNLYSVASDNPFGSIAIAGAWFGTLGFMLNSVLPLTTINMLDIDPRCEVFVNKIINEDQNMSYITKDMFEYHYKEDIIINTSCEHIWDLREWINIIPLNKIIVLQSNNFTNEKDHINCVYSTEEFVQKSGLGKILYKGEFQFPMYTRYMIIGRT